MGRVDIREGLRATFAAAALALLAILVVPPAGGHAAALPEGFEEETVFSGLVNPTAVRFSPDGRVFVAEKSGLIKVFSDLDDPAPSVFADLRTRVHNFWDRGLLGFELDPGFPAVPYLYVLYTHDFDLFDPQSRMPRWGSPDETNDGCPDAVGNGCVVSGRLSRLEALGNVMTGEEQPLIEADWCQQFPSHSVGTVAFGPDGALYASAGDGASFNYADYGQSGNPLNPCDDPPVGRGGAQTQPTAEGGALRSQDLRTATDPTTLDGSIIRIDPATGDPLPDNPGTGDDNARRIVAHGFRNPFRFTVRPGTGELWIGDVGWTTWEEINVLADPVGAPVENFGWPCYEGTPQLGGYSGLNVCQNLHAEGTAQAPHYAYHHSNQVVPGESCPTGGSVISGIAFYEGGVYPDEYDGALFFADHNRRCVWAMLEGPGGDPDPAEIITFVTAAPNPVDLQIGPCGDLFYVDHNGGTIRRVRYPEENCPPVAVATANVTSGSAPLEVDFDGTGSSDPDGDEGLEFAWDLDGDGQYDDAAVAQPSFIYDAGTYDARLRVTDADGESDISDPIRITAEDTPPVATIEAPGPATTWAVGEVIAFAGGATDAQDGVLPPAALSWALELEHCPSPGDCHVHPLDEIGGVASGSFEGPDHEYPSQVALRLTATDSGGLTDTATVRLDPETVPLTLRSAPVGGVPLTLNGLTAPSPLTAEVIVGARTSIAAPAVVPGRPPRWFASWAHGGARAHEVVAPETATTYTARYRALPRRCGGGGPNVVAGTRAGERLTGTPRRDALVGLAGRDVLRGRAGDDCLVGNGGADRLLGGRGDDVLIGGPGNDVLRGGPGRDVVRCGPGRDLVVVRGGDRVARDCERVRRR